MISLSISFLLGVSPNGHQYARPSNARKRMNMPRVVDMFYREIDAKAILGYLVFDGLSICRVSKVRRINTSWPYGEPEFLGK